MMLTGGGSGAPAGFLSRISSLEREVSFLKQKVEDDARWKHILQQWVLDNFAFDIQGTLLHGIQARRYNSTTVTKSSTSSSPKNKSSSSHSHSQSQSADYRVNKSKVKVERIDPIQTRNRSRSYQDDDEEDENEEENDEDDQDDISGFLDDDDVEQVHCFGGVMEDGLEVNVHPKDLIITPDICADKVNVNSKRSRNMEDTDEDFVGEIEGDQQHKNSSEDESDSSSEEEQNNRRTHRKMEWTLIGTYPNVETMKQQFNLREWGLSTRQITPNNGVKIYYYCKECRKHGPGRLLVKYKSDDSEVEVLKNHLEHDHSTKKRLSEEIKVEIVNLYNAGMTDSPKILSALLLTKPHMRQPTVKQICHILKPLRRLERKLKFKEKKKAAKEKEKLKMNNASSMDLTTGGEKKKISKKGKKQNINKLDALNLGSTGNGIPTLLPPFPSTSSSTLTTSSSTSLQQQHISHFMNEGNFQRPHIVSVTGVFPTPTQQLQQFYQQQHSPFDPANNSVHNLGQHYP